MLQDEDADYTQRADGGVCTGRLCVYSGGVSFPGSFIFNFKMSQNQ